MILHNVQTLAKTIHHVFQISHIICQILLPYDFETAHHQMKINPGRQNINKSGLVATGTLVATENATVVLTLVLSSFIQDFILSITVHHINVAVIHSVSAVSKC
jgi:hypothetical protein